MAALRLELAGKDREVHELAGNVHTLQAQLEQVGPIESLQTTTG